VWVLQSAQIPWIGAGCTASHVGFQSDSILGSCRRSDIDCPGHGGSASLTVARLEFYHTLRSNGVKTKLLVYDDDDHAIEGVKSEADLWINIKKWFDEH
jgi:hypothetical protein